MIFSSLQSVMTGHLDGRYRSRVLSLISIWTMLVPGTQWHRSNVNRKRLRQSLDIIMGFVYRNPGTLFQPLSNTANLQTLLFLALAFHVKPCSS